MTPACAAQRNATITAWFSAWRDPAWTSFDRTFSSTVTYSECWGPLYRGLPTVRHWFRQWHLTHRLNEWAILGITHTPATSFVEWRFSCTEGNVTSTFNGCSVISWAGARIQAVREYSSTLPQYEPYKND